MSIFTLIWGTLSSGLGTLFSYLVGLFIQHQQEQAAATQAEQSAIDAHAGDGAQSVADAVSVDAQEQDIQNQLQEMRNASIQESKH